MALVCNIFHAKMCSVLHPLTLFIRLHLLSAVSTHEILLHALSIDATLLGIHEDGDIESRHKKYVSPLKKTVTESLNDTTYICFRFVQRFLLRHKLVIRKGTRVGQKLNRELAFEINDFVQYVVQVCAI